MCFIFHILTLFILALVLIPMWGSRLWSNKACYDSHESQKCLFLTEDNELHVYIYIYMYEITVNQQGWKQEPDTWWQWTKCRETAKGRSHEQQLKTQLNVCQLQTGASGVKAKSADAARMQVVEACLKRLTCLSKLWRNRKPITTIKEDSMRNCTMLNDIAPRSPNEKQSIVIFQKEVWSIGP